MKDLMDKLSSYNLFNYLLPGVVSAAKNDEDHPRKSFVRAFIHRGARVDIAENRNIQVGYNKPQREGWSAVEPLLYPEEQED